MELLQFNFLLLLVGEVVSAAAKRNSLFANLDIHQQLLFLFAFFIDRENQEHILLHEPLIVFLVRLVILGQLLAVVVN